MASNAKNLAEYLNNETTSATADIADGSITTAKLADGGVTTAKVADNAVTSAKALNLGRRNLVINGAMNIAQRGTSSSAGGYCALDRFFVNLSGAAATFSQETVTLGDSVVGDFIKYARLNVSTGNNFCMIRHRIENVQSVKQGTATISFYAKGTNPGGGVCTIQASQRFGSGGSGDVDIAGQTFTLTSSWQRFDFQFTIPSISGKTIGTGGTSFQFDIGQGSDTSTAAWQIDITGIQVETGSVATDFEHLPIGEELALCQRYYEVIDFPSSTRTPVNLGQGYQNRKYIAPLAFKVEKRATPTSASVTWSIDGGDGTHSFTAQPSKSFLGFSSGTTSPNIGDSDIAYSPQQTIYGDAEL